MNEISFAESIDRLKESFLWAAAKGGNTQDCESLVEIGADINFKGTNGDTPLLAACRAGHTETVAFLLAHGADSNIPGADSMAPIHVAASRGDANTLDRILEANVSTGLKTREGMTALDIAKAKGHEGVYARLMGNRRIGSSRAASSSRSNVLDTLPTVSNNSNNMSGRENLPILHNLNLNPITTPVVSSLAAVHPLQSTPSLRSDHLNESEYNSNSMKKKGAQDITPLSNSSKALKSSDKNYSIMGDSSSGNSSAGSTEETIALKKLLDNEISKRKAYESKLEVFTKQNKQLVEELTSLNMQLQSSDAQIESLETDIKRLKGEEKMIGSFTIEECEALENELKSALSKVEKRKAVIIKNQIEAQKEQRLCVICQEKEKSVVLLPCRHLCLCDACSLHSALDMCPLCREAIVHKISVFS